MGLMDRDYWREKHNARKAPPDLTALQRSLDRATTPARAAKRSSGPPDVPTWAKHLTAWLTIAAALYAAFKYLGR